MYESYGVLLSESWTNLPLSSSGYWMGLAASVNFPGKTIEACLQVLHTDILEVWNIQDDCGVNTSMSSPLLTLTEIVLLVSGKQGTENANDHTCRESI